MGLQATSSENHQAVVVKAPNNYGIGLAAVVHEGLGTLHFGRDAMLNDANSTFRFDHKLLGQTVEYDLAVASTLRRRMVVNVRPAS